MLIRAPLNCLNWFWKENKKKTLKEIIKDISVKQNQMKETLQVSLNMSKINKHKISTFFKQF